MLVEPGATLQAVAAEHLGKASAWPRIAEADDIDDPMSVPPGVTLLLPPL